MSIYPFFQISKYVFSEGLSLLFIIIYILLVIQLQLYDDSITKHLPILMNNRQLIYYFTLLSQCLLYSAGWIAKEMATYTSHGESSP